MIWVGHRQAVGSVAALVDKLVPPLVPIDRPTTSCHLAPRRWWCRVRELLHTHLGPSGPRPPFDDGVSAHACVVHEPEPRARARSVPELVWDSVFAGLCACPKPGGFATYTRGAVGVSVAASPQTERICAPGRPETPCVGTPKRQVFFLFQNPPHLPNCLPPRRGKQVGKELPCVAKTGQKQKP